MCIHNGCFDWKYLKDQNFSNEIFNFAFEKNLCILHGRVFVMSFIIGKCGGSVVERSFVSMSLCETLASPFDWLSISKVVKLGLHMTEKLFGK